MVNLGQFPKIVTPIHTREFTTDKGCSVTLTVVITTDKGFSLTLAVVDADKGDTTVKGLTDPGLNHIIFHTIGKCVYNYTFQHSCGTWYRGPEPTG